MDCRHDHQGEAQTFHGVTADAPSQLILFSATRR